MTLIYGISAYSVMMGGRAKRVLRLEERGEPGTDHEHTYTYDSSWRFAKMWAVADCESPERLPAGNSDPSGAVDARPNDKFL